MSSRRTAGSPAVRLPILAAVGILVLSGEAGAAVANWNAPNLDKWFYHNGTSGAGTRAYGPTWIGGLEVGGNGQFLPRTKTQPARQGTSLVAFNTATQIATGLPPAQYQINSVTVTLTMENGSGQTLIYDDTAETHTEILNDFKSGSYNRARPMEMFGVGFRGAYTGYGFSDVSPAGIGPPLMDELSASSTYFSGGNGYTAYPMGSDANGYLDVSNSFTGGFSETAPGNTTAAFTATPWAIGKVEGLVSDVSVVPDFATFTFTLDSAALNAPGVRQYVQESLSDGALGFFFSSAHLAGEMGAGGGYPQWFMKEIGVAEWDATLSIDYSTESAQGDYDGDGNVDAEDYAEWAKTYGNMVAAGTGADGNGDTKIDALDYVLWRLNSVGSGSSASVVPEPTSGIMLLAAYGILGVGGLMRHRSRQPVPRGFRPAEFCQERN